uniref:B30.2/SPRY domain-containing protein n=1 Tax=Electrophorus electricus TaxID=8005 RepID=A0AAY5EP18_ELEEL
MHVYSTLPSLLGKDGENAVPLRVWLYPLSRLGLTEAPRVIEISSSCSTCIFPIIEDFDTIELKCNHLLNEAAAQTFPVTHGNIMDLKQSCLNYKKHFIEKIGSLLVTVTLSPASESTVKRNLEYKMKQEDEWKSGLNADSVYEMRCTIKRSNPTKDQSVIKKDTAMQTVHESPSHVVTAVLYGADAYFTSEERTSKKIEEQIFEGEIKLNFHRCGGIKTGSEKATPVPEKFGCTFSGDFNLQAHPTSVIEAINLYTTLPNMLPDKEEKAVPLRLWLYPYCKPESNTAKIVRDIHSHLITDISDVIHNLNIAEKKCNDLVNDTVARTFPGFCTKILILKKECRCYKFEMMRKVGSLLPSICQGEKESALSEFLTLHEESPYNSTTLDRWFKVKEEESSVIKIFLQELQDIGVDNDDVSDPETNVVCFTFTSLDQPDDFLSQLSDYVKTGAVKKERGPETENSEIQTWLTEDVRQRMREKLQLFKNLKTSINGDHTKFTVSSKHHNLHPGACVMVFKGGASESEAVCFTPPSKPFCSTTDACDVTLDPNTAHTRLSLSEGNRKVTEQQHRWYPDHPERFDVRKQVVCRESLTGPCYWEAEWSGKAVISVTYKDIRRKGGSRECGFGCNLKSWSLFCSNNSYSVFHNKKKTALSAPCSSNRVGVYLDWAAGTLSFYSVSSLTHTLTRLHTFHSTFTEPLYAGFGVWGSDSSVCVCV